MTTRDAGTAAGGPAARVRGALLRRGLPRDAAAGRHVTAFLVAAVVTVLLTRGFLAAAGYPQVGGGGLHVAHVLWGGLLMAVAFVLLLSFVGPVVRPLGAVVGGIGFGLFVDEIGKFVTSDNDYFYEPTAALIYVTVVGLALLGEGLQGRRAHDPLEALAGAVDAAAAGVAGGFSPRARERAHALLEEAQDAPGHAEVAALLDRVESDHVELPDPAGAIADGITRASRRLVRASWVPWLAVVVLVATAVVSVMRASVALGEGADVPTWVLTGIVVGAAATLVCSVTGLVRVRTSRAAGFRWFRRGVLVSLLVTQVLLFRLDQWVAVGGLVVDLLVYAVVAAELAVLDRGRGDESTAQVG